MSDRENLEKLLDTLNVGKKRAEVLKSTMTQFDGDTLTSLDLNDLGLESLPENVLDEFAGLEKLVLSFNNITSLPAKLFAKTKKLYFLNAYQNKISELPDDIFEGLDLKWLDLRSNGLTKLPKSLATQENLESLFLQNNPGLTNEFNQDFHTKRDMGKIFPEIQKALS